MISLSVLLAPAAVFSVSVCCQQQAPFLSIEPPISRIAPDEWKILNDSVGGRLFLSTPLATPCYDNFNGVPKTQNQTQCKEVERKRFDTNYLTVRMAEIVHV